MPSCNETLKVEVLIGLEDTMRKANSPWALEPWVLGRSGGWGAAIKKADLGTRKESRG